MLINRDGRQSGRLRASGNDDILGIQNLLTTIVQCDGDLRAGRQLSVSLYVGDLILFEQTLNSFGQACHGLCFGLHHLGEVNLHLASLNTDVREAMDSLMVKVRRIKKSLGRNTPDIQACPT